jgi:isocitrate/isopropylmalate dehydrogenase
MHVIGPEVVEQALQILEIVSKATSDLHLDISTHLFGGSAIDATGKPLPDETLAACKAADAVLMGECKHLTKVLNPRHPPRLGWWSKMGSGLRSS